MDRVRSLSVSGTTPYEFQGWTRDQVKLIYKKWTTLWTRTRLCIYLALTPDITIEGFLLNTENKLIPYYLTMLTFYRWTRYNILCVVIVCICDHTQFKSTKKHNHGSSGKGNQGIRH
jgi:hypothetical protein